MQKKKKKIDKTQNRTFADYLLNKNQTHDTQLDRQTEPAIVSYRDENVKQYHRK